MSSVERLQFMSIFFGRIIYVKDVRLWRAQIYMFLHSAELDSRRRGRKWALITEAVAGDAQVSGDAVAADCLNCSNQIALYGSQALLKKRGRCHGAACQASSL